MSESQPLQLISHRDYVRALRPHLPPEAFQPAPRKLLGIACHTLIVVAGIAAIIQIDLLWVRIVLSLLVANSVAGLAFYGHDLSHNSIVRTPWLRSLLELWVWSIRLMPPTLWRRLHNLTHHVHSNTPLDCDRQFLHHELNLPLTVLERTFTPFSNPVRWNPLLMLTFILYTIGHIAQTLVSGWRPGPSSTRHVTLPGGEFLRCLFDLVVVVALQVGLLALTGWDWSIYLWCGIVPIVLSSTMTMAYIFTNHFLNPVTEVADPVQGTTSVIVPRWVDWLHCNFSYHTEHHLFPSLNSDFYPLVSRLLVQEFPQQYHRIPMWTALCRLWSIPLGVRITPALRREEVGSTVTELTTACTPARSA